MGHSFTAFYYHAVFSTKGRQPWVSHEWRDRLFAYAGGIARAERCSLLAAGGMPDHIHLLIKAHPSVGFSDVMRIIKSRTSGWIHETITDMREFGWQNGYGAFSVSKSVVGSVTEYIATQEEHHRTMTFQEEFIALLNKHGVEYDPQYIWK